jgi:hypothetical protein
MDDWYTAEMGESGWGAWEISVRLATMPDGNVAPIGLRIEPREDYDGSRRDQRLTTEKMRRFPIGQAAALAKGAAFGDEWEALAARAEALESRADLLLEAMNGDREQVEAGMAETIGARKARLVTAAGLYRVALAVPDVGSPRHYVAERLGVSLTTVDRLLRDARKEGLLEPYDGGQGKHGKQPTERKRNG